MLLFRCGHRTALTTGISHARTDGAGVAAETADSGLPDLVLVPGGGWNAGDDAGAGRQAEESSLPDALARLHERGVTSGIDLALYLLEREFGPDVAASVAETMAYERRGPVSTPERR